MLKRLFLKPVAGVARMMLILASVVIVWVIGTVAVRYPLLGLVMLVGMAWGRLRHRKASIAYGSATTASVAQMETGGLLAEDGLILGRCLPESPSVWAALSGLVSPQISSEIAVRTFLAAFVSEDWLSGRLLRVNDAIHLASFSPAGGGKGVGVLIPNLLAYPGSCVVIDPKGELFRATAEHRRTEFGHHIIRIDPFNVCGHGGSTLNPFDFVDATADDFLDQIRAFADTLIIRQPDEREPHWNDSASIVLTAFSSFVSGCTADDGERTLSKVRVLASSRDHYAKAIEAMRQTDACQGVIQRLGGLLTWYTGEELGSVLATFSRHTQFLDSPVVARNVATSSFDPMILRTDRATVYLILPHDRLVSLSRLQRLWIGTIMRRITSGRPTEENPVLWLLDEMAHIGQMHIIEDAVTLYRGMGMRLWFIVQSLGQLKTCFGDKATAVLDNIGTQQYFGINSYETAEEISKRIGEATVSVSSENHTQGDSQPTGVMSAQPQSGNRSTSRSVTISEIARRLIKPDEVLRLSQEHIILFHKNLPVTIARMVRFYDAPEFRTNRFGARGTAPLRRLGVPALIIAACILVASSIFAVVALAMAGHRPPAGRHATWQTGAQGRAPSAAAVEGDRLASSKAGSAVTRTRPVWRNRPRGRRAGPSGFLIKIK